MLTNRVGIRDLKKKLSAHLKRVKAGQSIIITDRGRPVGRIIPEEEDLKDQILRLQRAGLVSWNGKKLKAIQPPAQNKGEMQVSDILIEMRE